MKLMMENIWRDGSGLRDARIEANKGRRRWNLPKKKWIRRTKGTEKRDISCHNDQQFEQLDSLSQKINNCIFYYSLAAGLGVLFRSFLLLFLSLSPFFNVLPLFSGCVHEQDHVIGSLPVTIVCMWIVLSTRRTSTSLGHFHNHFGLFFFKHLLSDYFGYWRNDGPSSLGNSRTNKRKRFDSLIGL